MFTLKLYLLFGKCTLFLGKRGGRKHAKDAFSAINAPLTVRLSSGTMLFAVFGVVWCGVITTLYMKSAPFCVYLSHWPAVWPVVDFCCGEDLP